MKELQSQVRTRNNDRPLTWSALWTANGWSFSNDYHKNIQTLKDGSQPDKSLWDFHAMLGNEIAYGPQACALFLEILWEDIEKRRVGYEHATERWERLCEWISATTDAAPDDANLYSH